MKTYQVLIFMSSLFLTGCFVSDDKTSVKIDEIQEIRGEIFSSYYSIKFRGKLDLKAFQEELDVFFKGFNDEFSTYQKDSLITKFNDLPKNKKMKTSPRFIEMLKFSKDMNEKTRGAFEPTLRTVINAWGFGGAEKGPPPTDAQIELALSKVGMKYIQWEGPSLEVWKTADGVAMDLNAFAPGWASDLIGELLEKHQIHNYMVDISGEMMVRGEKRQGKKWIVGIEKPTENYAQGVQVAIALKDIAIATSGDYRQFYNEKGERKSHIIDPRTGRPADHKITSASVVAKTAREADAWSTAMMVLGEEGLDLAEKNHLCVNLLKVLDPNKNQEINTDCMLKLIEQTEF